MTIGALSQIKNYNTNSTNNFLELDPQISFFKIVYRKYTRFAMENIKFDNLSRSVLNYDSNTIITADIPRNGDLLKKLYFTFELPNIYSGCYNNSNNVKVNYEFKWIKNIGINIFNSVKLKINGQIIDTLYSDYINIWKELHLSSDEKSLFNKNIGNYPELYDPKNNLGQNGRYPSINNNGDTISITNQGSKYYNNSNNNVLVKTPSGLEGIEYVFPSIQSKKIKVPLPFSFFVNSGLSLPLMALQYSQLSIEIDFKKFRDLFTIIDPKYIENSESFNKRIKPTTNEYHDMTNFTSNFIYNIKPNIEGEYIFLDDDERNRFAINDHEMLITQHKIGNIDGINIQSGLEEVNAEITPGINPVKYLTWVVKRDDYYKHNEWSNYTNWINEDIPPYSIENFYNEKYYNMTDSKLSFYDPKVTAHKNNFKLENLKKNILTSVKIEFDGISRIDKDIEYFEKQQPYQHFKTNPKDGIFVYSFSLNPLEYQPSGCCNFSSILKPKIYFRKQSQENFSEYNYRAFLYVINYNIFIIQNGVGNLKFTN